MNVETEEVPVPVPVAQATQQLVAITVTAEQEQPDHTVHDTNGDNNHPKDIISDNSQQQSCTARRAARRIKLQNKKLKKSLSSTIPIDTSITTTTVVTHDTSVTPSPSPPQQELTEKTTDVQTLLLHRRGPKPKYIPDTDQCNNQRIMTKNDLLQWQRTKRQERNRLSAINSLQRTNVRIKELQQQAIYYKERYETIQQQVRVYQEQCTNLHIVLNNNTNNNNNNTDLMLITNNDEDTKLVDDVTLTCFNDTLLLHQNDQFTQQHLPQDSSLATTTTTTTNTNTVLPDDTLHKRPRYFSMECNMRKR
jgi:hypothetical protein